MKTKLFRKINLPPLGGGLGWGLLTLLLLFSAGCSKDDDNDDLSGGQGITLTVALLDDYYNVYNVELAATAQQLIIDWGDGSGVETYANITAQFGGGNYTLLPNITHAYTGSSAYTVQIKGEGITHFECHGQALASLDVSKCPALEWLNCWSNRLTSVDVSRCPMLWWFECHNNQLTSLDVSGRTVLRQLKCDNNRLTSLNINGCMALQKLECNDNQLTSLDISGYTALKGVYCRGNQLTSLNVSGCTMLDWLWCQDNQLSSLNVSGCTALWWLQCQNNQLIVTALNTVFTTLPSRAQSDGRIHINNNPGAGACNRAIAQNKGWSFD